MDKLTVISGILFFSSEVFAIASLAHPDWINTGAVAGALTLGLTKQCQTIFGRDRICFSPTLPPEWICALFFLSAGIACLAGTCILVVLSHWHRSMLMYARWVAFSAIGCLCHVGILFPIGFRQVSVGGAPFNLPAVWSLGDSYKLLWVFAVVLSCSGWCILMMPMRMWLLNR
uniref:modulator of smoothened protein n=1 Tax=Ciona intestinalis TaxID=7719 RepID=UPI00005211A9|nr:modulator of smoothened protein [Ciona intestinalis]|eukprot:XP_026689477.1 modulator of smoothened protein [Ciona intestinalis]